jgi:hypothetical protein
MDNFKINYTKIYKNDSVNLIILVKDMYKLKYKNLKKTGKDMSEKDYFKMALLHINDKKFNLTEQTKKYMTSLIEMKKNNKPFILNKKSKNYLKALKNIEDDLGNIEKKNLKETKDFIACNQKILKVLMKYKLNTVEKDSIMTDFYVSIGFDEIKVKLLFYKIVIDGLEKFLKLMLSIEQYEKTRISKKK